MQYYIKKADGGKVSDGKSSSKYLGTTDNEQLYYTQNGCRYLNSDVESLCTQKPEKNDNIEEKEYGGDKKFQSSI